jgi:fructan beta-fructosidase
MSTEPFRPRLHFSPAAGWLNDPNGLIVVDGVWHIFYQHHPHSTLWGPMHWGHASSRDLVNWTHQPIALKPDALGTCFSGSAIETPDGEIKLFYTAHAKTPEGGDHQTQCLVHADRALTSFSGEARNPVVPNPGLGAFRDPKVVWHAPTARWIMVVTHGQSIGIHSSADLVHWTLESEFGAAEGQHGKGPWECPDLLPLGGPDGATHWVLLVGIASDSPGGGSGTQYFVGDFDGHRFVNANPPETVLWLDNGRDFYAAQTFFGAVRPTMIAWASNWQYASHTPTEAFRGVLSLPREMTLVATPEGLRLSQSVPPSVSSAFETVEFGATPSTGTYRSRATLDLDPGQSVSIRLFDEVEPQFVFAANTDAKATVRSVRTGRDIEHFRHNYQIDVLRGTSLEIELFVDNGLVELSVAGGLVWLTDLFFPEAPAGRIDLTIAAPIP